MAGDDPAFNIANTESDFEIKREVEDRTLHRMAMVHDFSEMWQGSQDLCTTQNESRTRNMQMTPVRYISDTEKVIKASSSYSQHDGVAIFKLSERSPVPPALAANHLPGGRSQVLNVRRITRIDHDTANRDQDTTPESISDSEN